MDSSPGQNALTWGMAGISFQTYMTEAIITLGGRLATDYGMPTLFKGSTEMPLDALMDFFRGFKGVSIDIRRRPDDVLAACEALYPLMLRRACHGVETGPFPGIFIPLHIPTYLRPKDFGKFYYPTFRRMIDDLISFDLTPILFMEGNWEPYYDFINELPKKKVVGLIEHGDFKKCKAAIGDTICIWGGMNVDMLNHSTKAEAVRLANEIVETLAPGGGFIFGLDKSLLAPNDANPENLKAVVQAVAANGVYS